MDCGEDQLVGGGTREGGEARGVMHDASACNACAARGCMRIAGVLVEGVHGWGPGLWAWRGVPGGGRWVHASYFTFTPCRMLSLCLTFYLHFIYKLW